MMSLRAYAKRAGVSAMAVSTAIKHGRLVRSVTHDEYGQPKIADPDLADQEWAANTDASKVPPTWRGIVTPSLAVQGKSNLPLAPVGVPTVAKKETVAVRTETQTSDGGKEDAEPPAIRDDMTMGEASTAEKIWKARQAELKYRTDAGELIELDQAKREIADLVTSFRTRLLGLPSRLKSQDPSLTLAQIALVESLVREALETRTDP